MLRRRPLLGAVACCVLALALRDAASAVWLLAQLMHSIIPFRTTTAERLEAWAWRQWEEGGASSTMPIQVPEVSAAAVWADLERPFIVRGLLDGAAALENRSWLRTPPVGELLVPYYSDASGGALRPDAIGTVARVVAAIEAGGPQKLGTELVFRRHPELLTELGLTAPLARLWKEFTAARHAPVPYLPPAACEDPCLSVHTHGSRRASSADRPSSRGGSARPSRCRSSWARARATARRMCAPTSTQSPSAGPSTRPPTTRRHPQHVQHTLVRPCVPCAPLHPLPSPLPRSTGSATLQLGGRKKWTLIPGDQSYRLRPSLAPDGRAFFCTRRAHGAAGVATLAAAGATHYEVEQRPGDVLWVPTWTWHRVDYLPNVTALSVSLFHVRAEQLAAAQPLLTAAMVPALLKELVGWKTQ